MAETKQFSVRLAGDLRALVEQGIGSGEPASDVIRRLIERAVQGNGGGLGPQADGGASRPGVASAAPLDAKPFLEQVASAWTALSDQMLEMAATIGKCHTKIDALKAETKGLRQDLRKLVRTLDDCFDSKTASPAQGPPTLNGATDHVEHPLDQ